VTKPARTDVRLHRDSGTDHRATPLDFSIALTKMRRFIQLTAKEITMHTLITLCRPTLA
jgi:hypothetical protein